MSNTSKVPLWAKLRIAKTRIKALERREQSILRELDDKQTLCERLQAERDNYLQDCKALQEQADKCNASCKMWRKQAILCNERISRVLALLEDSTAKNTEQKTMLDYTGLDYHFQETITLEESKQSVMEAASVLAMLPHIDKVDERAAYCHTIAECLYEYTDLLNRIGER